MSGPEAITILKFFVIGLVLCAGAFLAAFVFELQRERIAAIETHWGGFGAGLGGWQVSRSLLYLIVALSLAILATVLSTSMLSQIQKPQPQVLVDKYQSVARLMGQQNVRNVQLFVQGNKLTIKGDASSAEVRDRVWDQVKLVNPTLDDVSLDISAPKPANTESKPARQTP